MRWQSSNVPRTANVRTLPPQHASCCACRSETLPCGYSTATSTHGLPCNAAATAAAGVARGRNQYRQLASLAATDALHASREEARTEILERAGRAMKQLEHRQRRRRVRQAHQRRREVERFVADRGQLGRQRIAGRERRQQPRGDLRQLDVGFELPRGEVRKFLRNVQPAVRRDAARNGFAERHSVVGIAGADVVHVRGCAREVSSSLVIRECARRPDPVSRSTHRSRGAGPQTRRPSHRECVRHPVARTMRTPSARRPKSSTRARRCSWRPP